MTPGAPYPRGHLDREAAVLTTALFAFLPVRTIIAALWLRDDPRMATALSGAVVVLVAAATLALLLTAARAKVLDNTRPRVGLALTAYLGWTGLSLLWTGASSPLPAAGFWAIGVAEVVAVILLAWMSSPKLVARWALGGLALGGVLLWAGAHLLGAQDSLGRLGDVELAHPGTLGYLIALGYLAAAGRTLMAERSSMSMLGWGLLATLALIGVVQTLNKASIVACVAGTMIIAFSESRRPGRLFAGGVVAGVVLLGNLDRIARYTADYSALDNGNIVRSLSGRTDIWDASVAAAREAWLIGHGFLSFRDAGPVVNFFRHVHAHNELLQTWFQFGVVGVALLVMTYMGIARSSWRAFRGHAGADRVLAATLAALFTSMLIRGTVSASASFTVAPLAVVGLLALGPLRPPRRKGRGEVQAERHNDVPTSAPPV